MTIPTANIEAYSRLLRDVRGVSGRHADLTHEPGSPVDADRLRRVRVHADRIVHDIDVLIAEIEGRPGEEVRLRQDAAALADAIAVTMRRHGEAVAHLAVSALMSSPAAPVQTQPVDADAPTRREARADAVPADPAPAAVLAPAATADQPSTPAAADPADADPDFGAPAKPSLPQVAPSTIEMPIGDLIHDPEERPGPIRPASTPMSPPAPPSTDAFEEMMATPLTGGPAFADRRGTRRTTDLTPDEEMATARIHHRDRPCERPTPPPPVDDDLFRSVPIAVTPPPEPVVPSAVGESPRASVAARIRRVAPNSWERDVFIADDRRPGRPLRPRAWVQPSDVDNYALNHGLERGPLMVHRVATIPGMMYERCLAIAQANGPYSLGLWLEAQWTAWADRGFPPPTRFLGTQTVWGGSESIPVIIPEPTFLAAYALAEREVLWTIEVLRAVIFDAHVAPGDEAAFGLLMQAGRSQRIGGLPPPKHKTWQSYYRKPR